MNTMIELSQKHCEVITTLARMQVSSDTMEKVADTIYYETEVGGNLLPIHQLLQESKSTEQDLLKLIKTLPIDETRYQRDLEMEKQKE